MHTNPVWLRSVLVNLWMNTAPFPIPCIRTAWLILATSYGFGLTPLEMTTADADSSKAYTSVLQKKVKKKKGRNKS